MLRAAIGRAAAATASCGIRPAGAAVAAPTAAVSRRFSSNPASGGDGKPQGPAKKTQTEIFKDFEATLDANELRPLLAENAEELLREAAEAIPHAPGYRGSRHKKRERERLRVVRRGDYVKKLQVVARHEERMQQRSGEAINERLARLGLPALPKKAGGKQQQQQVE